MRRNLSELRVKLCGLSVSKSVSKRIPNPVGLRQEKLSHTLLATFSKMSPSLITASSPCSLAK